jgi:hypothetical protein
MKKIENKIQQFKLYGDPLLLVVANAVKDGCVVPTVKRIHVDQSGWSVWCICDAGNGKKDFKTRFTPVFHIHNTDALNKDPNANNIRDALALVLDNYMKNKLWLREGYGGV